MPVSSCQQAIASMHTCSVTWSFRHSLILAANEDNRAYSLIQKLIRRQLLDTIPGIMFEDSVSQNQSQRILVKDMQKFADH